MELEHVANLEQKLSLSIKSGITFLHEHQLANGEFCCYYAPDEKMQVWCVPDSTTFPTAMISSCLLSLRKHGKVAEILSLATVFLRYQAMTGSVWNYFTKWNPLFRACPADADSTVFASYVLEALGCEISCNRIHLLANRNRQGLFYTWFVLRPTRFKYLNREYIKIMARELKRPLHTVLFWLKHEASRSDIDAVVNANVLLYLGLDAETKPLVNFLVKVIIEDSEVMSDNWYKNPLTLYYFISRNYRTIKELEPLKDCILQRILAKNNPDGSFNSSVLETALSVSTLLNFEYKGDLTRSIRFLVNAQQPSGCWERQIFFYSGRSKAVGWGSEELSTGYCLEALEAYRCVNANRLETC